MGNIINRVFDSSGPEGKVRGTPQQIIEKYQILARDAQLSNDRVAAENFMQHAEHYTRMLAEAQRELAAEQEQRRPQGEFGQNGNQHGGQGQGGHQGQGNAQQGQQRDQSRDGNRDRGYRDDRFEQREEPADVTPRQGGLMDFIDELGDSGLVETPEARSRSEAPRPDFTERRDRPARTEQADRPARVEQGDRTERRRDDRKPRHGEAARTDIAPAAPEVSESAAAVSAPATEGAPPPAKRPRAPRKPRVEGSLPEDGGPAEAAE